jgi:ankyrin repeat protein
MESPSSLSSEALAELKQAFECDDADALRRVLDQHPEARAHINEPIGPFDSPAITCVKSRAMLDALLEAGADINARSRWWAGGFGLLDSASPELAAYAIERGAALDAHSTARLGMIDELRALVTADPSLVHARGGDGQTPLHFASTTEVAQFLLDQGADIDARDLDHESTPAQWMSADRQEIARYLVSRGCQTDILLATALGELDLVRRHLDADPDCIRMRVSDEYFPMVNPKSGGTIYQWTLGWYVSAHQVARKFGREEVLQLLLERSPPEVKLIDACWQLDEDAARALLAENPGLTSELTHADRRHLAHAARNNETQAVRLFLETGFPADATSQHQATALHWAAFHGNLEMTRLLLAHKPPLEALDADFHGTPLRWAVYGSEHGWYSKAGDYAGTVEALLQAGAKPPTSVSGSPPVQEVLLRWMPDITASDQTTGARE